MSSSYKWIYEDRLVNQVILHEMGHRFQGLVEAIIQGRVDIPISENRKKKLKSLLNKTVDACKRDASRISNYAQTKADEAFAEAYTFCWLHPDPELLSEYQLKPPYPEGRGDQERDYNIDAYKLMRQLMAELSRL